MSNEARNSKPALIAHAAKLERIVNALVAQAGGHVKIPTALYNAAAKGRVSTRFDTVTDTIELRFEGEMPKRRWLSRLLGRKEGT